MLLSGLRQLWTNYATSDFLRRPEGMRPFILLTLCAQPPQNSCSQFSTGFLLCFLLSRRLSLLRLDLMPCVLSPHSTILEVDPVVPVINDYLPAENCFVRFSTFCFQIGMTGIPIRISPPGSPEYISTALNLKMGLEAVYTLGNWV